MARSVKPRLISEKTLQAIENKLGYKFTDNALLRSGFVHNEQKNSQFLRSAFIGDSVLGTAVTIDLADSLPSASVGTLSSNRSDRVCNRALARLVVKHDFLKHFTRNTTHNEVLIKDFVIDPMHAPTPKIFGDLMESILGAVYEDSGRNLDIVSQVFLRLERDSN